VDSRLSPQDVALSARKIAEEFASLLLTEMLKSMRATLSGEGLDGDASSARDTYAALADVEVTRTLAKRDGMGLVHFLAQPVTRMMDINNTRETSPGAGEEEAR
jgi:Rod binding domain-containing protein